MLVKIETEIADDVVIQCPQVDFKLRVACKCCPGCEHYDGVGVMVADMSFPWHKRYAIRCTHPIERRTQPAVLKEGVG